MWNTGRPNVFVIKLKLELSPALVSCYTRLSVCNALHIQPPSALGTIAGRLIILRFNSSQEEMNTARTFFKPVFIPLVTGYRFSFSVDNRRIVFGNTFIGSEYLHHLYKLSSAFSSGGA
jgi:hypothetical protein